MRTLIVGYGYVGSALAGLLVRDGHSVWGMKRDPEIGLDIETIFADVTKPETIGQLPASLDAVIYAVGAGTYDAARYRAVYEQGQQNLISTLIAHGHRLSRYIFVSSTGVYAQQSGEWVDETSPAEQTHFSGATLLNGERIARESGFPATIVRFGGIYGPGRTRLVESVRDCSARVPQEPSYINLIHRDDCAGMLQHILKMSSPHDLYIGVDNEPVDRKDLLNWIADQLHVSRPPDAEDAESKRGARGNKRCSNARIRKDGYVFAYPTFREGFAELLLTE